MNSPNDILPEPPGEDKTETPPVGAVLTLGAEVDGRYRVMRYIGTGGSWEVYQALDVRSGAAVALKILQRRFLAAVVPSTLERFPAHVALLKKIEHKHVCRVFESGIHDGLPFLVMERLTGTTLARELAMKGRLEREAIVRVTRHVCDALSAAHEAGAFHGGLKSSNVFLLKGKGSEELRCVVTDFAIAGVSFVSATSSGSRMIVGTPAYLAPEQVCAEEVTHAADIYAMGVLLYEMVTGQLPFAAGTTAASAALRLKQPPLSPRAHVPELPVRWENAILKCLARLPSERYGRVSEIAETLDAADPPTTGARPLPFKIVDLDTVTQVVPIGYHQELEHGVGDDPDPATPAPSRKAESRTSPVGPNIMPRASAAPSGSVPVGLHNARTRIGRASPRSSAGTPDSPEPNAERKRAYRALRHPSAFKTPPALSSWIWAAIAVGGLFLAMGSWLLLRSTRNPASGGEVATRSPTTPVSEPVASPSPAPSAPRTTAPPPATEPAHLVPAPAPAAASGAPSSAAAAAAPPARASQATAAPSSPRRPANPETEARFAELLKVARRAYGLDDYNDALDGAKAALQVRAGDQEALYIAGLSACKLGNATLARGYIRRLKGNRQAMVSGVCANQDIATR